MSTLRRIVAGMNKRYLSPYCNLFHVQPTVRRTPSIVRFSSNSEEILPAQFNVLKDVGIMFIEQKKSTNLGSGFGRLVDYNVQTKDGTVLFVLEHFYGRSSPYFYVKIKKSIQEQKPLIHMALIRDTHNNVNGMTYFVHPSTIIGTLEPTHGDLTLGGNAYALKCASGDIKARLFSNGAYGEATKIRLLTPEVKIIGKLSKIKQLMIRSWLDAELHFPVDLEIIVKVKLIGAAIYLMGPGPLME